MRSLVRTTLVATATVATVLTGASVASAAPSGGGSGQAVVANPANVCAAIPATLARFGVVDAGFRHSTCVRTVAGRVPDVPGFGDPSAECADMEQVGMISYPYTFYSGAEVPFPSLKANNREQCARALWTFHQIATQLPPPPA